MMVTENIAHGSAPVLLQHALLPQLPHASALSELLGQLLLHAFEPPEQPVLQQHHAWCRPVPQVARLAPHVRTRIVQQVWNHERVTVMEAVLKVWGNGAA